MTTNIEIKEPLITFKEIEGKFEVLFTHKDSLKCLTHYFCFPAKFTLRNGEELVRWISHSIETDQEKYRIVHEFHATDLWFELYVNVDGSMEGKMRNHSNEAITWMSNDFSTYYYDRYGQQMYVEVFDEEGEDLPDNPATCIDCGHKFRLSHEFVEGRCRGCHKYHTNDIKAPDLSSKQWQWDV